MGGVPGYRPVSGGMTPRGAGLRATDVRAADEVPELEDEGDAQPEGERVLDVGTETGEFETNEVRGSEGAAGEGRGRAAGGGDGEVGARGRQGCRLNRQVGVREEEGVRVGAIEMSGRDANAKGGDRRGGEITVGGDEAEGVDGAGDVEVGGG